MIRIVIIDDERLARQKIRRLLKPHTEIEILAECTNGNEALTAIKTKTPDLIFLDIQMPTMDGFQLLSILPKDNMPEIIFVTAYDQYAVKAFEVYALDYILKPFDSERFEKALERAKNYLKNRNNNAINERILACLEDLKKEPPYLERLAIKQKEGIFFLRVEEIDWIAAEGNYSRLHVGKKSYLLHKTLSSLESQLNSKKFLRIERSAIVNFDRVAEIYPLFRGDCRIILHNGKELTLSRTYRSNFPQLPGRIN